MITIPEKVKELYKNSNVRKNYRIVFPIDNLADICNNKLQADSVKINEKLCSGQDLKFGLCEGSSLEFVAHDIGDLTGKYIEVIHEVDCTSVTEEIEGIIYKSDIGYKVFQIPLGFFTVASSVTNSVTKLTKVIAYNKLKSEYLDKDVKDVISNMLPDSTNDNLISLYSIEEQLLNDYKISKKSDPVYIVPSKKSFYGVPDITFNIGTKQYSLGVDATYITFDVLGDSDEASQVTFSDFFISYRKSEVVQNYYQEFVNVIQTKVTNPEQLLNQALVKILLSTNILVIFNDSSVRSYPFDYTGTLLNVQQIALEIPYIFKAVRTGETFELCIGNLSTYNTLVGSCYTGTSCTNTKISDIDKIQFSIDDIQDVSLREITSSHYELLCQFGELDRISDLFSGVELNSGGLYPAASLYPTTDLYPSGAVESTFKNVIKSLYTNAQSIDKFRNLIVCYKSVDENGDEIIITEEHQINSDGTVDYYMKNNWIFNNTIVSQTLIDEILLKMVNKMKPLKWFPFSMDCVGLPYLECGDLVEIRTPSGTFNSYILERYLSGIWNLNDEFENGRVNSF